MKSKIAVLVAVALLVAPVAAQALDFAAGLRLGRLKPEGKVQSNDAPKFDLDDALDIEEDSPIGMFVRVDGSKHHVILDYSKISFDGDRTLNINFNFEGQPYTIGADVDGKLEFSLLELTYYYDLWETSIVPGSKISLSPLVKLSLYDTDLEIESVTLGFDESFSESLPLPSIGLICTYEFLEIAKVSGQVNAIGISGNTFMEYEFIAGVKPLPYLNLEVGYKAMQVDFDESGDALDFEMGGMFGQVSFVHSF